MLYFLKAKYYKIGEYMTNKTSNNSNTINTILRGADVLEALFQEPNPIGVSSLSKKTNFPKVTTFRILNSLVVAGLVRKDQNDEYSLSPKFILYGNKVKSTLTLRNIAEPVLENLAAILGENTSMGVPYKGYVLTLIYINRTSYSLTSTLTPLSELYCSSMGKIILSYKDDDFLKKYFNKDLEKHTNNTVINYKNFLINKAEYEKTLVMFDNEEFEYGLSCFAVPVFDANDNLIAAINVNGPATRLLSKENKIKTYLPQAAKEIQDVLKASNYTVEELQQILK